MMLKMRKDENKETGGDATDRPTKQPTKPTISKQTKKNTVKTDSKLPM